MMPNVWVSTDLHLWSQENDSRHPYRSQRQIDDMAEKFAQVIKQDDILLFLGDLCDPAASDLNKVAAFVRSIPCTKLMCRGNHDTEDDAYYLEAGFDQISDLIRMHNVIFSHKPVNVAPDEVNVHAHLHTQMMSALTSQHINAYGPCWGKEIPLILLDDLLAQATLQSINGEETMTSKMWEEMNMYTSIDHDHYKAPVDITDMVPLCPVDESGEDTLIRIIKFNEWINKNFTYGLRINGRYDPKRNTTAEDWDKYLIVQSPQQIEKTKVGVCWDYTSYEAWYFKKNFPGVTVTAWYIVYGISPDCPTHTFLTFEYEGNCYYFDSSFSDVAGVWAADSEKDILNFVIDSMVKHDPRLIEAVKQSNFGLFKYDPLDEELFGLGCVDYMQWMVEEADEVKHRYNPSYKIPVKMNVVLEATISNDILDEILFQDSEDVKYWMTDDKTYRKKAEKGEESDKSVAAIDETTNPYATKWNDRPLYYVSPENLDDELYPVGKCLWETVPRAAFYRALRRVDPAGPGEFWVHVIEPGYYQLRSSVEEFGAWWSTDEIMLNTVGKVKVFVSDDGETYMDWLFKYVNGVAVECNPDGTFKDEPQGSLQETAMASNLDKDHAQRGKMLLSSLKRIIIDEGKRKELSNSYGFLKHFYGDDEWHQTVGWMDRKGNLVAAICVSKPDPEHAGQMWLTDFEIVKEYRGYGLSKQILDYACGNCGADALGVAKDNKIARKVYEDYGFKYGNQVHKKDKAGTNRLMYLPETVVMVDPENTELVSKMTAIGYTWADWKNRGKLQPMVLQEMAYEDAADLMRHRLGHYCKEFNGGSQFEQIEKVWKKNWPDEKPPKLSAYMEVSSDGQLCFNLAHEINTDNDDGLKKVATYTKIMHDLRKKLEKDKEIKDCAYIVGMYDLVEDGVLLYVNLKGIDALSADSPEVHWPDVTAFEQPRENENDYVSHDGVKVVFENDKHIKIGEVSISGTATDEPYLYDLEVYPRYRGKKYGNSIMRHVMQKYKPTELCVEWKNEIAQKLYERFGFKKDAIIEDYHTTMIVMRTKRKHAGSFKSNEESISESVVETHPMDRDEKKKVAEKYGIRPVGQTDDAAKEDAAIEKQKELDRKKKERLKQLERGRKTQKRNRLIKKVKSHLPGAKNEGAGSDEDDVFYLTDGQNTESGSLLGDHIEVFKDPKQFEEIVDEAVSGYRFELLDHVQFFDRLDENAVTDKVFHPVYVVLMHTGSLVATAIKTATNCEFSHVSIAFDSGLKSMFSFGGHKTGPNGEPQHSGFKKESLDDNFFKDRKVPYAIYAVPCTKGQLSKMKKRLDYFVKNENKFYFDFTGLIKNFFGISDNPQNRWFCSRFVSDILNAGTPSDPLVKDPALMRPEDFKSTDFAFRVDSGEDLRKISSKKIDRATKTAFKIVGVKKAAVMESAMRLYPDNPYGKQILMYQLAMMDEGAVDGFIQYLRSFKIRVDGDGNILITRREFDQLDSHFRQSIRMIKSFEAAGNVQGVKDELCKIHYMIELINQYYLREDVKNLKPTAKDVRKDMLDLRSVMLNVFKQHLRWVTQQDGKWNFQRYYDSSKYGKNVVIPNRVVTAVGRTIITALA